MEELAVHRILLVFALCNAVFALAPVREVSAECLGDREYLTGDLFGVRPGLAEHGVVADLQLTQFYQGVADGGQNQTSKYGGKLDYFLRSRHGST